MNLFSDGVLSSLPEFSLSWVRHIEQFDIDCNIEDLHFMGNCFEFVEQVLFSSLPRLEFLIFDAFSLCGNPDTVEGNRLEFLSEIIFPF